MDKSILPAWQAAALTDPRQVVDAAAALAAGLTRMRMSDLEDVPGAMREVARDYKIGYSFLWGLRYRRDRVKDVGASIFFKLRAAYEAECARQIRKLEHETAIARQVAGADDPDVCAAAAVVADARQARRLREGIRAAK